MGAVSFRFFSKTASAEGLASSVSRFLFLDLIHLLGGVVTTFTDSTSLSRSLSPTLSFLFSSLKNISILNQILALLLSSTSAFYFLSSVFFCSEKSYLYIGWRRRPASASLGQSSSRADLSSLSRLVQWRSGLALQTSLLCSTSLV